MKGKLFLICGDDDYLVDAAARERIAQLVPADEREHGVEIIEGRKDTGDEAARAIKLCMESAQMAGMFGTSSTKVTWLRDATIFAKETRTSEDAAEQKAPKPPPAPSADLLSGLTTGHAPKKTVKHLTPVERFTRWLSEGLPEGQHLIITATKILRTSVFFKTCQKHGEVIDFGGGLKPWEKEKQADERLEMLLEQVGIQMDRTARREFIARVGFNTRQQVQELEKLRTYLHPRLSATINDVREITSVGREADAWDVTDAFGERNPKALLLAINPLSGQRGAGIMLAAMLEKTVRDLIILREAFDKKWASSSGWSGTIPPETAVMLGTLPVNPKATNAWALRKKLPHAMNYTLHELRAARFRILDMREKMVSTGLPEMHLLQSTLLRIIGKGKK